MALYVVDPLKNEIVGELKEITSLSVVPEGAKLLMAADVGDGIPVEYSDTETVKMLMDKDCSMCIDRARCAIHDNFNVNYCSDWRCK